MIQWTMHYLTRNGQERRHYMPSFLTFKECWDRCRDLNKECTDRLFFPKPEFL